MQRRHERRSVQCEHRETHTPVARTQQRSEQASLFTKHVRSSKQTSHDADLLLTVLVWQPSRWLQSTVNGTPATLVLQGAWHPVSAMQVSGSRDTSIRLWKRSATEAVAVLSAHTLPVTGLATIDHHNQICSGSRDCAFRLWDAATSANVACAEVSQNLVTFMSAVPTEPAVLQTGEDLSLRLWDTRVMQAVQMLPQHSNIPLCCDVSLDGEDVH